MFKISPLSTHVPVITDKLLQLLWWFVTVSCYFTSFILSIFVWIIKMIW